VPFGSSQAASYSDKEILKYAAQLGPRDSVVLDAQNWPVDPAASLPNRYVVPAGTILKLSVTNSKAMVPYDGSGSIKGILAAPVDLLAKATSSMEPAAMYFHAVVFATKAIVNFTNYASALVSSLPTCKFQ
jgi:hypothetical protein